MAVLSLLFLLLSLLPPLFWCSLNSCRRTPEGAPDASQAAPRRCVPSPDVGSDAATDYQRLRDAKTARRSRLSEASPEARSNREQQNQGATLGSTDGHTDDSHTHTPTPERRCRLLQTALGRASFCRTA